MTVWTRNLAEENNNSIRYYENKPLTKEWHVFKLKIYDSKLAFFKEIMWKKFKI